MLILYFQRWKIIFIFFQISGNLNTWGVPSRMELTKSHVLILKLLESIKKIPFKLHISSMSALSSHLTYKRFSWLRPVICDIDESLELYVNMLLCKYSCRLSFSWKRFSSSTSWTVVGQLKYSFSLAKQLDNWCLSL